MTTVLPIGYVTILEAADMPQPAMHAGVPDSSMMIKLRQEGLKVNDEVARDRAIDELWNLSAAGDLDCLRPHSRAGLPAIV
jgi:hypothetical protein